MKKTLPILIYVILIFTQLAYAMGLSTTFGRVRVENIKIDQTYSMEEDANTPLVIENTSDIELELDIDVLIPKENELIEGYLALPDKDWITIKEDNFILLPQSKVSTDVIISIPDDDIYRGKKYQVYIWSHTKGTIAVGLKSKLLIEIAE